MLMLWLMWVLRGILLPFFIGVLLAWLLQPAIDVAQRRLPVGRSHPQLQRVAIILGMYILVAAVIGLLVFYAVSTLGKSLLSLIVELPRLIPLGVENIELRLASFLETLPLSTQQQVSAFISQAGTWAGQALTDFISGGIVRVRSSSNMILGFVALPVFLFYLLKDWHTLREDLYRALPPWTLIHVRNTFAIVRRVIGRYLQAQLMLGLAVGIGVYILLTAAGIRYALPLAVFAGITELVPIVGPWLSSIVGILTVLALAPGKALWVAVGYLVIQLIENHLLGPRIQGQQMNIHPAIVIVLAILAASVMGLAGFLIVLPLTMTVVELVKYARSYARDTQVGAGDEPPTLL